MRKQGELELGERLSYVVDAGGGNDVWSVAKPDPAWPLVPFFADELLHEHA